MARGRTALSFEEKVEQAKTAAPTHAQKAFSEWLIEVTEEPIDLTTLILVQRLYPEYIKTDEASENIAERKARAAAAKAERDAKAKDNFMKRAEKLGLKVTVVEESDAE